jgi:hypothetical protein
MKQKTMLSHLYTEEVLNSLIEKNRKKTVGAIL